MNCKPAGSTRSKLIVVVPRITIADAERSPSQTTEDAPRSVLPLSVTIQVISFYLRSRAFM